LAGSARDRGAAVPRRGARALRCLPGGSLRASLPVAAGMSGDGDHDDALDRLIQAVDLDGLVRLVDARCATGDWAGLRRLRDRCAAATRETGRQLWPGGGPARGPPARAGPPRMR